MSGLLTEPVIKVCGVRERGVFAAAVESGATAIGLNFVAGRRRALAVDVAERLVDWARTRYTSLPALVGVFMDATIEDVRGVRARVGLDWVQLHGTESADDVRALGRAIKALPLSGDEDLQTICTHPADVVLVDARINGVFGGTGRRIPADLVARACALRPLIVAGGLHAENVAQLIQSVRPMGVDAASAAEDTTGRPSASRARAFVLAARRAFEMSSQADGPPRPAKEPGYEQ